MRGTDTGNTALHQFDTYDPIAMKSTPGISTEHFPYNLSEMLVTDFFGGVSQVESTPYLMGETGMDAAHEPRKNVKVDQDGNEVHRVPADFAVAAAAQPRPLTRQGYMLSRIGRFNRKDMVDKLSDLHASIPGVRWREWTGLAGLLCLGGFAWANSGVSLA